MGVLGPTVEFGEQVFRSAALCRGIRASGHARRVVRRQTQIALVGDVGRLGLRIDFDAGAVFLVDPVVQTAAFLVLGVAYITIGKKETVTHEIERTKNASRTMYDTVVS